ncbi:ArnT family glycosyltransferase [Rurimicrobium arvi]|uniref:Phospholipid carrier-dependent glycosyltransferase n=1 Tax=Rurimicrobium arvi TaxID=2049916 RepID=A0ABP8N376_9BACT
MQSSNLRLIQVFLAALILFVPFLGAVHLFDWDEINFAECAREMIVTKNYLRMQIDYQPFFEKPPLFIWLQVLSMKLFGINEFAARFPNALAGMVTFGFLFSAGRKLVNDSFGVLWVTLYAATWLPHFYFKTGIIDPVFNLFIFLAFYQVFCLRIQAAKWKHMLLAGLFLGLAVLTKGPVAILVSALSFGVYIVLNRGLNGYSWKHLLGIATVALLVTSVWFGVEWLQNGPTFIKEFLSYQAGLFSQNIADHEEPWYYHPIVLLIGCFPASVFLFQYSLRKRPVVSSEPALAWGQWMWILFWVVLILFSIVKTKIVHYSSLCYYPLTYLAARQIFRIMQNPPSVKAGVKALFIFLGTLWGIVLTALPLVGIYKDRLIPLIKDPFAVGNLQADVPWNYWECIPGIIYLLAIWLIGWTWKTRFSRSLTFLMILQVASIQYTMLHFVPKIEAYSQRAAIEFYEDKAGKDVYIDVVGFHSYAYLFYAKKMPVQNPGYYDREWLMHGHTDRPVYFVCKIQNADPYRKDPDLRELYEKNGFVFFTRNLSQ